MAKKLAIYVPAYNEEKTIASVVIMAKRYGSVCVVDDGSSDATASLAKRAGARVIRRAKNGGYGAALREIFDAAGKSGADAFVTLDGDFQHDPEEIPAVAAQVIGGEADVCAGSRFLGKFLNAPAYRKAGVGFFNSIRGAQAGGIGLDYECGFRAFSKKAARKIIFQENGYAACAEILLSAQHEGLKITQAPVHVRYYDDKKSSAFAHGAGLIGHIVRMAARERPLIVFGGLGIAMLAASAALGLFVVDTFYSHRVLAVGSAMLTVFFGIAGFVMISIGINLYTLGAILEGREKEEGK